MDKIQVHKQPQGTADVMIGTIVVKTFGGLLAEQAAQDFANQIRAELNQPQEEKHEKHEPTTSSADQSGSDGRNAGGDTERESVGQAARGWLRGRDAKHDNEE